MTKDTTAHSLDAVDQVTGPPEVEGAHHTTHVDMHLPGCVPPPVTAGVPTTLADMNCSHVPRRPGHMSAGYQEVSWNKNCNNR